MQTHLTSLNMQVAEEAPCTGKDIILAIVDHFIAFKWDSGWGYGKALAKQNRWGFNVDLLHKGETGSRSHQLSLSKYQFGDNCTTACWALHSLNITNRNNN